ncbi:MAG: tRNA pseudouridine(55) synthase TruB [Candidatus Nanopelagicales bacterium]|jgi:tRNA pseudouridine55 synthase
MGTNPPRGILVVDKPAGPSSHAVVSWARKALGTRKVGHAGTLDPAATGVLVLGVGAGTRLLGHLAGDDKEYLSTFVFGVGTTTDDAQGEPTVEAGARIGRVDVTAAMQAWTGDIMQRPSAVSAIKVDGKRAYDLVRSGQEVDLAERPVRISVFELLDLRLERAVNSHGADIDVTVADVRVVGSSGTYVRALARDVAAHLGTAGHVRELRRVRSGAFGIDDAVPADAITEEGLVPLAQAASRSLPWVAVPQESVRSIRHGVQIAWPPDVPTQGAVAIVHGDDLIALAEERGGRARYLAVFPPID